MRSIKTNEEGAEVSELVETTITNTATTADGLYASHSRVRLLDPPEVGPCHRVARQELVGAAGEGLFYPT